MIKPRIKETAQRRGIMSANELRKAACLAPETAEKLFNNNLQKINTDTLNRLCHALKCTPNDLIEFQPDEKQ